MALSQLDIKRFFEAAQRTGTFNEAVQDLRLLLPEMPGDAYLLNTIGLLHQHLGQIAEAYPYHRQATDLQPENADYHYQLGTTLCQLGQFEQGIAVLERSLTLDASSLMAWHDFAHASLKMRDFSMAEKGFRRAIELQPTFAPAHYGLSYVLLHQGHWREGWQHFEWRGKSLEMFRALLARIPLWEGQDLQYKHIIVMAEQGFGDIFQFSRYLKILAQPSVKISIWAPEEIAGLVNRLPYIAQTCIHSDDLPASDFFVPLLSLPRLLNADVQDIPLPPYLRVDPKRVSFFSARLGERQERLRLAINWAGNPQNGDDRHRSARLQDLSPLLFDRSIRWISIQKGGRNAEIAQLGAPVEDWSHALASFDDTAGLLKSLDGVVSVCSAPIHLAGALQVQSLCLLSSSADWRWGDDPTRTPWYPTMNLVRQNEPGNWIDVARRASEQLLHWKARGLSVPVVSEDVYLGNRV